MTAKLTKTRQKILSHMQRRYGHYRASVASDTGPDEPVVNKGLRSLTPASGLSRKALPAAHACPVFHRLPRRLWHALHQISIQLSQRLIG